MVSEEELKNMSPEQIAQLQKENCIFCKIVKGEIPSKKVYEDDRLLAILDINPITKGHTLVMPKEHYPVLPVIPPDVQKHMFKTTKYLMKGVKQGSVATKSTLFIANGAVAGQQSPHFLFHIVPRNDGDGLSNFDIKAGNFAAQEAKSLTPSLKANIQALLKKYLGVSSRMQEHEPQPLEKYPEQEATHEEPHPEPVLEVQKQTLADILEGNEELKEAIMFRTEELKAVVKTDPKMGALFEGINIDLLASKMKEMKAKEDKAKKDAEKAKAQAAEPPRYQPKSPPGKPNLDKISGLFR